MSDDEKPNILLAYDRKVVQMESPCWVWMGNRNEDGYGLLFLNGKQLRAHRYAYESEVGPLVEGLVLDHLCMNKRCVNPDHMEPVTIQENVRRAFRGQTHCKWGHEYTPENTYRGPDGKGTRRCRRCAHERYLASKAGASGQR